MARRFLARLLLSVSVVMGTVRFAWFLSLMVSGLACGTAKTTTRPMSVSDHRAEATRSEARAMEHERAAIVRRQSSDQRAASQTSPCIDSWAPPDPESGGERIRLMRPCFSETLASTSHDQQARHWHREALHHRTMARELRQSEIDSCAGIDALERSHSPFAHAADIARVEAYREDGIVRGARIWFHPVAGLTAEWMSRAVRCHMARAAATGFAPTFMGYCPLALPHVDASVNLDEGDIVVTLRSDRGEIAAAVLGRSQDLRRDAPPVGGGEAH